MSASAGVPPLSPDQREALERLLGAHEPADETERAHLETIRDFVARHADPFDRRVVEGHLTGSAFVVEPSGRLLLTHHRALGIWIQLGGHADQEREAAAVARREAFEESGLSDVGFHPALCPRDGEPALLDVDVHVIPERGDEPEHLHLDLRFLFATRTPEAIRRDPREAKALEWVTLDEALRRGDPGMHRAIGRMWRLGIGAGETAPRPRGGT